MSETEAAPPPASFEFLIASFIMQAQAHLGMFRIPGPEGENFEPNIAWAKHAIDLLAVIEEKTKGNLTIEEKRMLENSLTELRFRFVQVSQQQLP
jgi:hypothetical protein